MRPNGLSACGMFRVPYDSYFSHFLTKNFKFSGNARSVHFFKNFVCSKNLFFFQIFIFNIFSKKLFFQFFSNFRNENFFFKKIFFSKFSSLFYSNTFHGNDGTSANNCLLGIFSRVSDIIFCTTGERAIADGKRSVSRDNSSTISL